MDIGQLIPCRNVIAVYRIPLDQLCEGSNGSLVIRKVHQADTDKVPGRSVISRFGFHITVKSVIRQRILPPIVIDQPPLIFTDGLFVVQQPQQRRIAVIAFGLVVDDILIPGDHLIFESLIVVD